MTALFNLARDKALPALVLLHLFVIALSNYLVQMPVSILGLHTTWGAFTFPVIFLATDLTLRLYGPSLARKIIFFAMLPGVVISYLFSVLFQDASFQGFAPLAEFNTFVARIAIASFLAYVFGQILDIFVFRALSRSRQWWVAPAFSSVLGTLFDTFIFFSIAFYQSSDAFMAQHWPEIATVDYVIKVGISLLVFVPAYGIFMSAFVRSINR
ncbi:MAG: 7-cyano-7-deazaguanine/7-aminomethyl-7-deazaguanine transporter [Thiotrichales bacterium]